MTTTVDAPVEEPAPDAAGPATATKQSKLRSFMTFELTKSRVRRKDLMHFSRQLAVFVRAGIPILEALDGITEEMTNKRFLEVLTDVRSRLQQGQTLSDALAVHPDVFPIFYVGMVRTAELSGTLDDVLDQLAEYIDRDLEARRKVVSALIYPGMIAVVGIGVIVIMVTFVLPRFKTFFKGLNAKLPLPTRMLLGIADGVATYWYAFVAFAALVLAVAVWMRKSQTGRRVLDRFLLNGPGVGDLVHHILLERFCRIMSSMMRAGVPLTDAMRVTSDATTNTLFREGLENAQQAMLRGEGLATPLAATGLFPASARQMMRVGENTGTLDDQLATAATFFERELDYKIKKFTGLFEPAVIIVIGACVGFVAVAMVSAMYGIFHQVHP